MKSPYRCSLGEFIREFESTPEGKEAMNEGRKWVKETYYSELEQLRAKVAELETALREAKEALNNAVDGMGGSYLIWKPSAEQAITTINKVLGEE